MRKTLSQVPPLVLAVVALLIAGLGFSIYKAVTSFGGDVDSPAYERLPSPAFALAEQPSIVDPQLLAQDRLPDTAYEQINATSRDVLAEVAAGTLTVADLRRFGMTPRAGATAIRTLGASSSIYAGRQVAVGEEITISPSPPRSARALGNFEYSASATGEPGGSVTIEMSFQAVDAAERWRLGAVALEY